MELTEHEKNLADKSWNDTQAEGRLREIIRKKINWKITYDGLDMSGYGDAFYKNIELVSRFTKYMMPKNADADDVREKSHWIPISWKGGNAICRVTLGEETVVDKVLDNMGGFSTEDILFELITKQNPKILEEIMKKE